MVRPLTPTTALVLLLIITLLIVLTITAVLLLTVVQWEAVPFGAALVTGLGVARMRATTRCKHPWRRTVR